jgi:PBP4 family serine-type D-alanyl-D-alanine carboxypeptidase
VDASLFPEGERELGTGVTISPIVVNDNVIDITVSPGGKEGDPAILTISPETGYVHFINQVKTGLAKSAFAFKLARDDKSPTGRHAATLEGSIALDAAPLLRTYRVPEPSVFAAVVFAEALAHEGVTVDVSKADVSQTGTGKEELTEDNILAEHFSPRLIDATRVVLKVSQNLHASMMPFVIGALAAHAKSDAVQAGFDLERQFLEKAGLDLSAASQSDGAGGAAYYSPDFMVHYLAYLAKQTWFPTFLNALPILGKDGTLWDIQVSSPAAGHVMAKTGTLGAFNALGRNLIVQGKGLAGFVKTKDGKNLIIAIYANFIPGNPETAAHMVGDALGEIAAAAYDSAFIP